MVQAIIQAKQMKIDIFSNPKPKTNLDRILSKNFSRNRLLRLVYKFAKLLTKINRKMHKFKT